MTAPLCCWDALLIVDVVFVLRAASEDEEDDDEEDDDDEEEATKPFEIEESETPLEARVFDFFKDFEITPVAVTAGASIDVEDPAEASAFLASYNSLCMFFISSIRASFDSGGGSRDMWGL